MIENLTMLCVISGFCCSVNEIAYFWNFLQCRMVVCCRLFRTAYLVPSYR